MIAPTLTSTTSSKMISSLNRYLKKEGYTPLIIDTNYNQLEELSAIEKLWHMNVDGIVLVATELTMAHHTLSKKLDIPFVVLGQEMKEGYSIVNDDYEAGFEVGKYAGKMNHLFRS